MGFSDNYDTPISGGMSGKKIALIIFIVIAALALIGGCVYFLFFQKGYLDGEWEIQDGSMFLESKETLGTLTISHEPNGDISISKSPTDTAYANAKKALVSQNTFDQTFATMTLADFKIHFNHVFNNMKLDDDKFDITVPNMEVTGMFLRKGGSSLDRNQFSVLFSPGNNPLGRLTFVKK